MVVYLVPVGANRYELYSEVPDEAPHLDDAGSQGFWSGLLERFRKVLAAIEAEHGHGEPERHSEQRPGWSVRARNRALRWVAERVAEQRLL